MPRISPVQKKPRKPRTPSATTAKSKASKSGQMDLNFTSYPDLTQAIAMLQKRQSQLAGEHAQLLDTWVTQLTRIQGQMSKLKKLEGLTSAARRPIQKS